MFFFGGSIKKGFMFSSGSGFLSKHIFAEFESASDFLAPLFMLQLHKLEARIFSERLPPV